MKKFTKKQLIEEYKTQSVCSIARKFNVSFKIMYVLFDKFGIKRRKKNIIYICKHGKCSKVIRKKCIDCGKELSTNPNAKRCISCHLKWRWQNPIVRKKNTDSIIKEWSTRKKPKSYCSDCGKELYDRRSIRCYKCKNIYRANHKKQYRCRECNKIISPGNGGMCKTCCKLGKRNNAYIHGQSKRKYTRDFLVIIRNIIMKRDNYNCKLCNKKGKVVHHIDYNKDNNDLNNLIFLCSHCHGKTNWKRNYWIEFFKKTNFGGK